MTRTSSLLLSAFFLAQTVSAHDLYLLPDLFRIESGVRFRIAVHNGDSFPESEAAPSLERLREGKLQSRATSTPIADWKITGKEALGYVQAAGPGTLLLSVHTIANFIELAPDKFQDYLKEEGLRRVMDWRANHQETSKPGRERYTKFAKSVLQSGTADDFYKTHIGFPIEIVPLSNPYLLHAGATLPVIVLFRGKPAADLQVEAAWADGDKNKTVIVGRTDSRGEIAVRLNNAGKWRLHSLMMERCAEPAIADWESSWASLTFEIR